ncbi:Hypothetical protein, conserved [Brucella ceti str. Cudo]|uniref:Uncharacterized protein n=2 Tax=Brucella TaxID=234 RepID=A0A0H3APA9_BRUO2|nr:hypothetical protein BOV_1606 [Brucella ovis ATCC 25840]EEH13126.1 Hypothetical protein, conserved [Brucella ceti str. Cudo]EFG38555.1 hypothetical protein BAZG_03044 [Brucella sp. NVSL 07-0026]
MFTLEDRNSVIEADSKTNPSETITAIGRTDDFSTWSSHADGKRFPSPVDKLVACLTNISGR